MGHYSTNYYKLLSSLSKAIDFNAMGVMTHHQRVSLIALQIGQLFGLSQVQLEKLFTAAIIHDAGSSTWEEKNMLCQFNLIDSYFHCRKGYELFKGHPLFGEIAEIILFHHDRWDGVNNSSGLSHREIPIESRIIHLADRVDVMIRDEVYILQQSKDICRAIHREKGKLFDPQLVEAFHDLTERECFWLDLQSEFLSDILAHHCPLITHKTMLFSEITSVAEIMARVIDNKSPFTHRHSRGVAQVAYELASLAQLPEEECDNIHVAGLLHDLGKMGVPEAILNKPGKLTYQEYDLIKRHSYYTYHILKMVDGFSKINHYASCHHETPAGTGYPFKLDSSDLQTGARIVAVADIFAALTEERPYRGAMEKEAVLRILREQVKTGGLDPEICLLLMSNYDSVLEVRNRITK